MEGYEGVAVIKGGPPPNGGLRGIGGNDWGNDWGLFFLIFRRPRALSDIEQGWGSKGEGLLPFTFGWVAKNLRRFGYE